MTNTGVFGRGTECHSTEQYHTDRSGYERLVFLPVDRRCDKRTHLVLEPSPAGARHAVRNTVRRTLTIKRASIRARFIIDYGIGLCGKSGAANLGVGCFSHRPDFSDQRVTFSFQPSAFSPQLLAFRRQHRQFLTLTHVGRGKQRPYAQTRERIRPPPIASSETVGGRLTRRLIAKR